MHRGSHDPDIAKIIDDFAANGIVVTPEEVKEQVRLLMRVFLQADSEGLVDKAYAARLEEESSDR